MRTIRRYVVVASLVAMVGCDGAGAQGQLKRESLQDWVARKLAYENVYTSILKQAKVNQSSASMSDPDRPLDLDIASGLVVSFGKDASMVDTMVSLMNSAADLTADITAGLADDNEYATSVLKIGAMASKNRAAGSALAKAEIIRNDRIVSADAVMVSSVAARLVSVRSTKLVAARDKLAAQIRSALLKEPDLAAPFSAEWPVPSELQTSRARVLTFLRSAGPK